jgi:hypothetical protein
MPTRCTGQREGKFFNLFNENLQAFFNSNYNRHFSNQLLGNQHHIDTIDNTMGVLYTTGRFHISTQYKNITRIKKKKNYQRKDQNNLEQNATFKALPQTDQ